MRLLAAALAAILSVSTAQAQTCAPRQNVESALTERYGEQVVGRALDSNNQVMEVWASEETGTWTITITRPNGLTCLVASGTAYDGMRPDPAGLRL